MKIELVPNLSHCIETTAKKEYEGVLKQLLTTGEKNERLVEKVDILRLFLQTTDFKKLRAEYEKFLIEGKMVKFVIYTEGEVSKHVMQVLSNQQ